MCQREDTLTLWRFASRTVPRITVTSVCAQCFSLKFRTVTCDAVLDHALLMVSGR